LQRSRIWLAPSASASLDPAAAPDSPPVSDMRALWRIGGTRPFGRPEPCSCRSTSTPQAADRTGAACDGRREPDQPMKRSGCRANSAAQARVQKK
jgi:hypothetical protein